MVGMPGFWPGFLALDRRTGGGNQGGWGEGGGEREIQFYRTFLILTVEITNPNGRDSETTRINKYVGTRIIL